MPEDVTEAMIEAALKAWWQDRLIYNPVGDWERMRKTIAAALDAAPSGHGERG